MRGRALPMENAAPTRPAPSQHGFAVNGIDLTYFVWEALGKEAGPPMVFAHATGFHARVFDALIAHFPARQVIAIDLRGHGRSTGAPVEHWQVISRDVNALLAHLDVSGAIGVGHSMGAHTLLQCAALNGGFFSRLVLFDPVVMPPEYYEIEGALFTPDNPHPSIRRRREFASPEAMMERFKDRDPYNIFDARVFDDYCRYGLIKQPSGTYELACPPEVEASIYGSSRSNRSILEAATQVDIPTLVVRAQNGTGKMDFKSSPTWPGLAASMPQGTDLHRADMTHFHPFQDPADAARIIAEFEGS